MGERACYLAICLTVISEYPLQRKNVLNVGLNSTAMIRNYLG